MQLVKEKWLSNVPKDEPNVLDYVSSFRGRLKSVPVSHDNLSESQIKMKKNVMIKSLFPVSSSLVKKSCCLL